MTNLPAVETKAGNRGITAPFLIKGIEPFVWSLNWKDQAVWRKVVDLQPVAVLCRETIVEKISTMEWRIDSRDPKLRSEQSSDIEYYESLFSYNREQNFDFPAYIEWVLADALDLPFGAGTELVYQRDNPKRRLVDYVPLDGATLFPTYNRDIPVVQRVPQIQDPIPFPKHAINRLYYSPRRELEWRGWGMPPPQKIYAAISMISKGDEYYWKFLVDTPEAGILDLIDMSKDSAEAWLEAFRTLLTGVDPLKIPVLYEHTQPAKYIPFGRPPSEIMLNDTVTRYAAIVAGGYGLTLSSLGFQVAASGGETLAGAIRSERGDRGKGIGVAKQKVKYHYDRMLPEGLEFVWIDPDEEQQVAKGRATLSLSTSLGSLISNKVVSPKEARQIYIASGLPGVALPEDIPEEEIDDDLVGGKAPERQNMLTATQPPSSGGEGEIRKSMDIEFQRAVFDALSKSDLESGDVFIPEFDSSQIFPDLLDVFKTLFDQEKSTRSWLSRSKYSSFESLKDEFSEFVEKTLETEAVKIAHYADKVKELALDTENVSGDNLNVWGEICELMMKSFSESIINYMNQKVKDL